MRTPVLVITTLASGVLGIATASALTGAPEDTRPVPESHDDARAGSDRIVARAPSPTGGPDYAVRGYAGATGLRCIALGRTDGKRFGRARGDDVEELAVDDSGSCAEPDVSAVQLAVQYAAPSGVEASISTLFGTVDRTQLEALDIRDPGGQKVDVSSTGGVLSVFDAPSEQGAWRVSVTYVDGRVERFAFDSR